MSEVPVLPAPPSLEGGTPLRVLVEALGPAMVRVHAAPDGLDAVATDVVIADPLVDEPAVGRGDVVLGVGVDASRREAVSLVELAGRAGAAAVVLRGPAAGPRLEQVAEAAGTTVLLVEPDMSWAQLHVLLRSARAAAGAPTALREGGRPLGDLFALADALAAVVGGPVTVEDPQSTVLAYSRDEQGVDEPRRRTILGRRVPQEWLTRLAEDGVFRRLWTSDEVVRMDYPDVEGFAPRMAVAVRAGGEVLGSIWVAQRDRPLDDDAELATREAARVAALHLLRHRSHDDLERRRRADRLRAVLEGRLPTAVVHEALGVPPDAPVAVIALRPAPLDGPGALVTAERAADLVALHCRAFRRAAVPVAVDETVHVVVAGRLGEADLVDLATELAGRIEAALRVPVRAAASGGATGPGAAATARAEAEAVLSVLERHPSLGTVASIGSVRAHVVLDQLRDVAAERPALLAGRVAALLEHDRNRSTQYVETLHALLDAFGDVRAAADRVAVHPNTFRYRVRRLVEVTGLDLDDPVERLVAHLQLHLITRPGARPGPPAEPASRTAEQGEHRP